MPPRDIAEHIGWVVPALIRREWPLRHYEAREWMRFCRENRLRVVRYREPFDRAYLIDTAILLPADADPVRMAWLAWHEIGHWACHVGNREFWRSTIFGEFTVAKFERQAWEFALLFPDWRCYLDEELGV